MASELSLQNDKERPEIKVRTDWSSHLDGMPSPISARQVEDKEAWLVDGFFTEEECNKLITEAECHGFGTTLYQPEYRGNLRLITVDPNFTEAVRQRLEPLVPSAVTIGEEEWDVCGLNECWRLAKYYPGHRFGRHCDEPYKRSDEEMSMFTVNIYMNGGFGGGNTRFYFSWDPQQADMSVEPKAGLCLLFRQPPGKRYYHDGEEVTSGVKYLFRSDVMYRRREGVREPSGDEPLIDLKKRLEPVAKGKKDKADKEESRQGNGERKGQCNRSRAREANEEGKGGRRGRLPTAPFGGGVGFRKGAAGAEVAAQQAAYAVYVQQFMMTQQAVYMHQAAMWSSPFGGFPRMTPGHYEGTIKSLTAKGHGFIECAQTQFLYSCDIYVDLVTLPKGAVVGSRVKFTVTANPGEHPKAVTAHLA